MHGFLNEEKQFLDSLKSQFPDLPEAQRLESFLQSKFIANQEITPTLFMAREEKGDKDFFNNIGKSVYQTFMTRFYSFVNVVFISILGRSFSISELANTETIKKLNTEFKEKVEDEPLFNDFFSEIVPSFNRYEKHLSVSTPLELAQLVRQCDYFDSILSQSENKEIEDKIEAIYELSNLFFAGLEQLSCTEEECLPDISYKEIAAGLGEFVLPSIYQSILISKTLYSESLSGIISNEIIKTFDEICYKNFSIKFTSKTIQNVTAKIIGGSNNGQETDCLASNPAA